VASADQSSIDAIRAVGGSVTVVYMEPISSEVLVVIIRQFHPGIHRGCFRLVKPLKMVYFQGLYEFTRGYVIYIYMEYL
jgi:hypothetical protein